VRRYHADFYRAANLCLVITGAVDAGQLLATIDGALAVSWPDAKKGDHLPRPWVSEVGPPKIPDQPLEVDFPSADEETGLVVLGWRGPAFGDVRAEALDSMLWKYLCDGAASPMSKRFVDAGVCSGVWPASDQFRVGYRQVWFEDVATSELGGIAAELDAALIDEASKGVDMARLRDVADRSRRRVVAHLEDDPCGAWVSPALKHFTSRAVWKVSDNDSSTGVERQPLNQFRARSAAIRRTL